MSGKAGYTKLSQLYEQSRALLQALHWLHSPATTKRPLENLRRSIQRRFSDSATTSLQRHYDEALSKFMTDLLLLNPDDQLLARQRIQDTWFNPSEYVLDRTLPDSSYLLAIKSTQSLLAKESRRRRRVVPGSAGSIR